MEASGQPETDLEVPSCSFLSGMLQYAGFFKSEFHHGAEKPVNVPFLDLKTQFSIIRTEVMTAIESVCDETLFVLGPVVADLERELAEYVGTPYGIGVASGSDALLLSLMALDVQPGDEIITVPFTFFSTAGVVSRLHAKPVFVDVKPDSFNIDPAKIEEKISSRTRAIIPVHLFGQCAEIEKIQELVSSRGIPIIEDACQAIGAARQGVRAGALGDVGCFSFFPSKNLGGIGDGGFITTHRQPMRDLLAALRVHGGLSDYHHDHVGMNSRLDALQAAVLKVKLQYLEQWNAKRRSNASRYNELFMQAGILDRVVPPWIDSANHHVFNQYTLRVQQRDQLMEFLKDKGIGYKVYYPVPLHLQECYRDLGYQKGDFPVSEQLAKDVLSLPIFPELTDAQLSRVVEVIRDFYRTH